MATLSPNPGPKKLVAHGDGTTWGWVTQGLQATNTDGGHALEQWFLSRGGNPSGAPFCPHGSLAESVIS